MNDLVDPKDPKNNQFSDRGLYVNDDDQDWGSAGMNDVEEDSEPNKTNFINLLINEFEN